MSGTVRDRAQRPLNAMLRGYDRQELAPPEDPILGPLEVRVGGQEVALAGARQRALLAALRLAAGGPVTRDRLIEEVWGPAPPASASHAVQVYVSKLRDVLGAEA